MHILRSCAIVGAAAAAVLPTSLLLTAPEAVADCAVTDGITACQNVIRRADTGPAEQDVWYPYPCEYDYLCDDGVSVVLGDIDGGGDRPDRPDRPDIGAPGRPDIGAPGRPGNRPGGGGGIGGGRR